MCKLTLIEAMAHGQLQLKREITFQECADALGVSRPYLSKIKNKILNKTQISKLEAGLGLSLFKIDTSKEYYEIPYLELSGIENNRIKNNLITSLWLDRELIENDWKKCYEDLRIIKMLGDKMNFGDYPLRHDDTLLVDIAERDILNSGIYVFTTTNNGKTLVFICGVSMQTDGKVKFYFTNEKIYKPRILTPDELEDTKFQVIGRVVKNLSLTL